MNRDVETPKSRPFPWKCVRCGERTMMPEEMDYTTEIVHDGRPYQVSVPGLRTPRCQNADCRAILLDTDANRRITQAFRRGVGRTTALMNVGFELARRGRKVLLVDFDLESPDLTSFPRPGGSEPHSGIVEYVAAYRQKGESPDVTEYLYPVETDEYKGCLWLMPAGRGDPAYWEALAGIDWQELYD